MTKEVIEKIRPIVESDSVSPESAEQMVKAQKDILEAVKPAPKTKEPVVTGHGASTKTELTEGELPTLEDLAVALIG